MAHSSILPLSTENALEVLGKPYLDLCFLVLNLGLHQGELLGIRLLRVFELAILGKPSFPWCFSIKIFNLTYLASHNAINLDI